LHPLDLVVGVEEVLDSLVLRDRQGRLALQERRGHLALMGLRVLQELLDLQEGLGLPDLRVSRGRLVTQYGDFRCGLGLEV
jgi:hypothetical protein